jgi:hypothetical protein
VGELSQLEIDDDQTTKGAVIEKKVDPISFGADPDAFLAGGESESGTEFLGERPPAYG